MIYFQEETHLYSSIVPDTRKWVSVTSITGRCKPLFPREQKAKDCSIRKPSIKYPNKWYGIPYEVILQAWDDESIRSTDLGTWYHKKRENELRDQDNVHWYITEGDKKLAPIQKLQEGIYPEHMVYLDSAGICGQVDLVEVTGNRVDINDYKTSKEITRRGYKNWEGVYKKLLVPLHHLEDCHVNLYALQMSLYMYMILRHNPLMVPGTMTIEHIKFVQESENEYGYPIYKKNDNGDYIVEGIEKIVVPYMKNEVQLLINNLKKNI